MTQSCSHGYHISPLCRGKDRPCRHQLAAAREQVGPVVGRFGLVPERVGQDSFANRARHIRAFGRPIPKRAAEPVHREVVPLEAAQQDQQDHVPEGFRRRPTGEHVRAAIGQPLRSVEDLEHAGRERTLCARPLFIRAPGNRPRPGLQIDFRPRRQKHFTRPGRREDEELKREPARLARLRRPERAEERWHRRVGQRRMVPRPYRGASGAPS